MKKILLLIAVFACAMSLIGCNKESDKTNYEIKYVLNYGQNPSDAPTTYEKGVGLETLPTPTRGGSEFLGWYIGDEKVTSIPASSEGGVELTAKWKFLDLTPETDALKLNVSYEGKDYLNDGIGVVTVAQYIDGDTTIFQTANGTKITVRYDGIDTPESTYKVEPWGFAAANFTKEKLKNATTIVLQTEDGRPGKDNLDNNGRYLAWVWADGRLINLEIVECGLSKSKATETQYKESFGAATKVAALAGVRVYGEHDDDYDYSKEGQYLTIKEIRQTYGTAQAISKELGKGTKVTISGTVVRKFGIGSAYVQQYDEETDTYYGIYVYGGYDENNKLAQGYSVTIEGNIGYYSGSLQITGASSRKVTVNSFFDQDNIYVNPIEDITALKTDEEMMGNIISIAAPLKITRYYDAAADESKAMTLYASYQDAQGNSQEISIRIDNNIALRDENGDIITSGSYFQGKTFTSFTGIVGYYDPSQDGVHNGNVQLLVTSMDDITIE